MPRLSGIYFLLLVFAMHFNVAAQVASGARAAEEYRDIRLPDSDDHAKTVSGFVEKIPDDDYYHASAAAYDAFNDMKYGIRIHWGIYSIKKANHESWGFLELSNEDKQAYQRLYMTFNPTGFNAEEWMQFFDSSGLKCFAFTTKHHEGFSMFDTKTKVVRRVNYVAPGGPAIEESDLSYSIMESPFHRDIVKELCDAAHKHNIRIDLYFSHPDWYDADFRPYNYHPLQTTDSRDSSLAHYGDADNYKNSPKSAMVPAPTAEETARMMARHREQLTELLSNYGKIDMICLDQWLGPAVWPQLKETIKALRKIQPDVMFRCRGIGNYGDYYTPEGFVPGSKENSKMPWMTIQTLGSTFSYDSVAEHYKGSRWIVENLIDAVSKGGSFMVGIGPDGTGRFHPAAIKQLLEAGAWLRINGEAIFSTRPRTRWKEGNAVRYTTTKDKKTVYVLTAKRPAKKVILSAVKPVTGSEIYLLGVEKPLTWTYAAGKLKIDFPASIISAMPAADSLGYAIRISELK